MAARLELALKADLTERAAAEQIFLGAGDPLPLCLASDASGELADAGVVRVRALSSRTAAELRAFVIAELERATAEVAQQATVAKAAQEALGIDLPAATAESTSSCFSKVLAPEGTAGSQAGTSPANAARWDLRLPLAAPIVKRAITELLADGTVLGDTMAVAAGGRDAEIWELAALISSPGAVAQTLHADTIWDPSPILLTAFIALQPISRNLGPTRFVPTSHTDEAVHAALSLADDARGLGSPPKSHVALLDTGDAALYDGRTLHCGGANTYGLDGGGTSDGLRVLFYVTLRHASRLRDAAARDDPARRSITADLAGQHTLRTLLECAVAPS